MNDATIRRQRSALQRTAQRRRDAAVLAASLLCHALLLLVLPGFAAQIKPPPVIYVKLTQPVKALGAGPKATAPKYAPVPQGERVGPLNPDMKKGTAQPAPKAPGKPKPATKTQAKAQAKPQAKPAIAKPAVPAKAAPAAKTQVHTPMLPAKPQAKPDTPRVEPATPAKPGKPAAKPAPAKPSDSGGSGGGDKHDTGGSAGSGGGAGGSGTPGGGSGGPPSDKEPGPGGKPGTPGAPDQGPAAPAGSPGGADKPETGPPPPPPPPPGPSQAELNLLEDYGTKAFKRIKSQARNSEQGVRGTVVFEFDVSRKGYLLDVRVVKSSGHNNLDQDVMEAARAAFNEKYEIIPFPKDISLDKWSFRKSIEYPLY
jgi:TonB family protein